MAAAEQSSLIVAIFEKGTRDGRSALNPLQQTVFDVQFFATSMITIGLAEYYLCVPSVSPMTDVESLRRIGDSQSADFLARANALFPGKVPPSDDEAMRQAIGVLTVESECEIDKCESELRQLNEHNAKCLQRFVARHQQALSTPDLGFSSSGE